jgi:hypothetical protein
MKAGHLYDQAAATPHRALYPYWDLHRHTGERDRFTLPANKVIRLSTLSAAFFTASKSASAPPKSARRRRRCGAV